MQHKLSAAKLAASLAAMAEGGDISGLVADVTALGAAIVDNPVAQVRIERVE